MNRGLLLLRAGCIAAMSLLWACPGWAQVPAAAERIKRFDKDGDGKVTAEELGMPNLFPRLDKNGDGVITADEVAQMGRPAAGRPDKVTGVEVKPDPAAARPHGEEAKAAGLDPGVLAKLDAEMQGHCDAKNVSGVIGLISKVGKIGYFEDFGSQDIEAGKAMPKGAIFRLQSMTKPIVAVAALVLFDEGKFGLDDPISKHLPEWSESKVLEKGELVSARHAITPRMLMSHSSGLYYGDIDKGAFGGGAVSRDADTTLETFSKELAKKPLKFHPGEGYQYGHSIDVLGRYIEAVSGKPLDEFLKEWVLGPLKMADTDFWVVPEKAGRIAQLYTQPAPGQLARGRAADQITAKPRLFLGGQGLCSTAMDYARFCQMLLNRGELDGARVLKAETVDLMFQNHLRVPGQKYGLGGAVDGDGGYSWGGANGTQFWVDRKHELFAVFMVQTQRYRAPTYMAFRTLANEAAGVAGVRSSSWSGLGEGQGP